MLPRFLDSNIFLRHLLDDVPGQSAACHALFQLIEAEIIRAWTSDLVIAEVVFVVSNPRTYGFNRDKIASALIPLIHLPALKINHKARYDRIFELYARLPIDYVDAFNAAQIESSGNPQIYSYDTDFDRIPDLARLEPAS